MPNYQGVWSLSTQMQNAAAWQAANVPPNPSTATFTAGYTGSAYIDVIQQINIASAGNSSDYGDMTADRAWGSGSGNTVRGIMYAGVTTGGAGSNVIEYWSQASSGNASDFGDAQNSSSSYSASMANSTRLVAAEGFQAGGVDHTNVISYVTIASTGNASDFGNLVLGNGAMSGMAGCGSDTRGIMFGGRDGGNSSGLNRICYITIGSTGNSTNFGNLSAQTFNNAAASSPTRGLCAGGTQSSTVLNRIEYITIASTSNSTDFGDLSVSRTNVPAGVSTVTRAVFAGGGTSTGGGAINVMDFVTIASTGNASDFGDLLNTNRGLAGASRDHGGLS